MHTEQKQYIVKAELRHQSGDFRFTVLSGAEDFCRFVISGVVIPYRHNLVFFALQEHVTKYKLLTTLLLELRAHSGDSAFLRLIDP